MGMDVSSTSMVMHVAQCSKELLIIAFAMGPLRRHAAQVYEGQWRDDKAHGQGMLESQLLNSLWASLWPCSSVQVPAC